MNWDSETEKWQFIKHDGTVTDASKLRIYYSEPTYLSIENNAPYDLTVSGITVFGSSVINTDEVVGYGYVFATDNVIREELLPIVL